MSGLVWVALAMGVLVALVVGGILIVEMGYRRTDRRTREPAP